MGLHATPSGKKLMRDAEQTAFELDSEVAARLTSKERDTLLRLLKKLYK
jgi:DNA-binding MarR family transcriptional regulator